MSAMHADKVANVCVYVHRRMGIITQEIVASHLVVRPAAATKS